MTTERSVEQRARTHAALADPARLRIVDHLCVGDAAPSELQAILGTTSNLLAHHVNVLESAGLVRRRRSEADRRRSYLTLLPAALEGLVPVTTEPVSRVVFVCTANSARSQLAASLWEQNSSIPVASAGTEPAHQVAPGAVASALRHGLRLADAAPRSLEDVLGRDDYVVTVCDNAHERLGRDGLPVPPAAHWSVPDPVRVGTSAAFDAAYDELDRRISRLAPRLTAS